MTGTTQLPPAGWYPDPDNPQATQRYWDGAVWTDNRAPWGLAQGPNAPKVDALDGLRLAGWIGAFLFVPLGFVCGVMLINRGDNTHGGWILLVSTIWLVAFIALFSAVMDGNPIGI